MAEPTAPENEKNAEAGPSPAETGALAWAAIDEASQRKRCAGARGLGAFLRDAANLMTPKGDERTNLIDQGERATYCFGRDQLRALFGHLEACRLERSATHMSERQGTAAVPRCGLMLDYDVFTTQRKPALSERHYHRMAGALAAVLQRDIDFAAQLPPRPGGGTPAETRLGVFFIVKPAAVAVSAATVAAKLGDPTGRGDEKLAQAAATQSEYYKYGFHVLVPGVRLDRSYKKWLLRSVKDDPAFTSTLQELGAVGDPALCLDPNSASVPVLLFGSCKRGGTPYELGAALEVTLDLKAELTQDRNGSAGWAPPTVIKRLEGLGGHNLVAELSLVVDADYDEKQAPLVAKREFAPRDEVQAKARDWAERSQGAAISAEELLLSEHSLSTLTLHDAEARHLHALLDLLGPEYANTRDKWRDVVYALANTNENYKPLAVWFSHKCPRKWSDGGLDCLDAIWDEAVARKGAAAPQAKPLTIASVVHWARASDQRRYSEVMERSYFTMLTSYVYEHGGRLQHYMVAKVLREMLGTKFCVDIDSGPRGAQTYCWFEFVLPGQPQRPGEVWKWRKEVEPDDLHVYMSEKLTKVLDQIGEHIEERRVNAQAEDQAKYYKGLGKAFAVSKGSLFNDAFKSGVVRQASFLFRKRGFVEKLDRLPQLFGTLNGVLHLGPRIHLIDYYHEYPVSRYTTVAWRPFDPEDPRTQLVLRGIADIIPEPDARDWILFHTCQGLSGDVKEGILLLWEGGGQNGKTTFLRWAAKAFGPHADKYNIQLLSSERESADRPNSAMMKFKHLNYAYCEETNRAQALNAARMKEIVNAGEVSGRDLNSKQETFTMRCNLVAASQYTFIIAETDHGTWRRLRHYTSKTKFRANPDPTNPYEKKEDQRYNQEFTNDPQFLTAFMSILGHYYERLQREYGGRLKNVPSSTVDGETEAFRISQDALHRWITETVLVSPETTNDYSLGVLGGLFMDWYAAHIDRSRKFHVTGEIIKEIEASALAKYLRPSLNRTLTLRGCRVLHGEETALLPGEDPLVKVEARRTETTRPPANPERWWEGRAPLSDFAAADAACQGTPARGETERASNVRPEKEETTIDDFFDVMADDEAMTRVERSRSDSKSDVDLSPLTGDEIERMLMAGPLTSDEERYVRPKYTQDDVYSAGVTE